MAFTEPTFNLVCNVFDHGTTTGPRIVDLECNLAWGRRVNVATTGGTDTIGIPFLAMSLLVPAGSDIRGPQSAELPDNIECPSGSGRFYEVVFVDDIGKGFDNEHRCAMLQQSAPWPTPIP